MENYIENEEITSEEFRDKLLKIKEEKDLIKYLQPFEKNLIIVIKELIIYFKEKINEYEKQINKLNDDKDELQMKINEMILQYLRSKEKYNNNNKNINDIENVYQKENSVDLKNLNNFKNNEKEENKIIETSLIYVNQKLIEQNKELKEQLGIFKNILDIDKKSKKDFGINKIENNINTVLNEENKKEFSKTEKEKEKIFPTILSLLKQLSEYKKSEKMKKDRKKNKEKLPKTSILPNIEKYFIINNKYQLVDSENNLFHMRKCHKFQEFKKNYKAANNSSENGEDILKEFVEIYEKNDEEKDEEKIDNLEDKKTSSNKPNIENNTNKEEGNNEENDENAKKENNNKSFI